MVKILIHSADLISKAMAGPAIRYWEFAKALSKKNSVTLATPNRSGLTHPDFKIVSVLDTKLSQLSKNTDFIITQYVNPVNLMQMKKSGLKVILDLYDPVPIEALEIFKNEGAKQRKIKNIHHVNRINLCARLADGILCANQEQFHLWTGLLMSQKYITPERYDLSNTFEDYIGMVPFGLPSNPPERKGLSLREKYNFSPNDKILLWGGGIWNWFDPLTLIESIRILAKTRADIKLVFMGVKHPNPNVPAMEMSSRALDLTKKYDLLDKQVFFNFEWVPYDERTGFLLDADIGISTHSRHLETRFAFRTRILDYIWCSLPIICTEGDCFAELVKKENLGYVVPYNNAEILANTIKELVDDNELKKTMQTNLARIREKYTWDSVTQPIEKMVERLHRQKRVPVPLSEQVNIFWSFANSYLRLKMNNQ